MLRTQITTAYKTAMKRKEAIAVSTLRLIQAAIKDRDIAARSKGNSDGISDDVVLSLLQSMIKQRRDSIEAYEKGGRMELAQREAEEISIIESFLPAQMNDIEIAAAVEGVISNVEATTLKDMGKVMGAVKKQYSDVLDFSKVSKIIKDNLN